MNFNIEDKILPNLDRKSLKDVKGIIIHFYPEFYNTLAKSNGYSKVEELNKKTLDFGFHYIMDQYNIVKTAKETYQVNSFIDNSPTYISNALCEGKAYEKYLSINLCISNKQNYEEMEKRFLLFVVSLLRKYKLKSEDVWRGYDFSKNNYDPVHFLSKDVFKSYLDIIDKYLKITDSKLTPEKQDELDAKVVVTSPFKYLAVKEKISVSEYVYKIIEDNINDAKTYANKFTIWDKELESIKKAEVNSSLGDINNMDLPTKNKMQYKITQNPTSDICNCEKPSELLEGVNTTSETMVEAVYPDIITPPGGEIHIANGSSETATKNNSSTPLNIEEFEKRQKTFSMDNFKDVKKQTSGRPANPDDEFPVDKQIEKLQQHYPKVKIDKTTFNFIDDNHLGSEIGQAMAKNYNMAYDMISEVSKRTEQRLVKIENNLSTVMRNLFRMSARVNINCVYYGGQSTHGKYKCIRCLHDNRLHDGAIVSLDQCLSCTRYEPIVGQIYAILDETGSNVVKTIDDIQLGYMNIQDYKELNSIERMPTEKDYADLNNNPTDPPKTFDKGKWKDTEAEKKNKNSFDEDKNGFVMDWNPILLETQKPSINEYEIENAELSKNLSNMTSSTQTIDRTLYVDTKQSSSENEVFEFDIANYAINDYSTSSTSGSSGSFGLGASDIRNKIVEYSTKAVLLCKEGKAQYSQVERYAHDDKAINGIHYWDCSSLVQRAYEYAGISGIGTYTANQYPFCLDVNGGLLIPIKNVSEALPGDMVWFKEPPIPSSKDELQKVNYSDTNYLHHIGIYIGDNQYAHASYHNPSDPTKDIKISTLGYYDHELAFGRVAELIKADKQASQGATGSGAWNKDTHGISSSLWNESAVADSNVTGMLENIKKYKYANSVIKIAKEKGFDPYFLAAIMAIESNGNPLSEGSYPGIMQSSSGYPTSTIEGIEDNIRKGCEGLLADVEWLKGFGWKDSNVHLLASAHNCGRYGTTDALGYSNETYPSRTIPLLGKKVDLSTCTIGEVSSYLYDYTRKFQTSWDANEKKTYAVKILRAYNNLLSVKALG